MKNPGETDAGVEGPTFEVPIQALEDALELPLTSEALKDVSFGFADCERLHDALYAYHQNNRIEPVTSAETVRPNLSFVSLTQGVMVDRDSPRYTAGSYLPRNGAFEVPIDEIKRTLLFSDAVLIEDPVFAFCRGVMCTTYRETRPPFQVLEQALKDLAKLRPLLVDRLLRLTAFFPEPIADWSADVPVLSDGSIVGGDVAAATDYHDECVIRLVAGNKSAPDFRPGDFNARRRFIRELMDEEGDDFDWLYAQAESMVYGFLDPDAYCPHLPNDYQYTVYKKLLSRNVKRITDLNIQVAMELNSGCATDPNTIDLDELLAIRRDEEVFSDWREMIRQAVKTAVLAANDDTSKLEIFKDEMKNRGRHWKAKYQKYNKGRLADVMTASKEMSVGSFRAVGGAAALLEPSGLLRCGSLLYSLCKSLGKITAATDRRAAEAAALSFFTVIQTPEPHGSDRS